MKRIVRVSVIAAIAGALLVVAFCGPSILRRPKTLVVRTYFADAQNLRVGAPVRAAGVNIGTVTSVRVDPTRKLAPAAVEMRLVTDYILYLPGDAVVSVQSDGIFGGSFASIRLDQASAPPIKDGGELPSERTTTTDLLKAALECAALGRPPSSNPPQPDAKTRAVH